MPKLKILELKNQKILLLKLIPKKKIKGITILKILTSDDLQKGFLIECKKLDQ